MKRIWSKEEDDIIRQYYPEFGSSGCLERLQNRTTGAIQDRASFLGIKSTYSNRQKLRDANSSGISRGRMNDAGRYWRK